MNELKPGMVGFTQIGGPTGFFVNLGQAILRDSCRWTHVFIVLEVDELTKTYRILEAMPTGARTRILHDEPGVLLTDFPLTERQRYDAIRAAYRLCGTKYGFSTYLSLALAQLGLRPSWLEKYISKNGRLICSQLVDEVLRAAGYHVFDDGRMAHDVTPGDLFYAVVERGRLIH